MISRFSCVQTKEIEDAIDLGQIEEVIEAAKGEQYLIGYYYGANLSFIVGFLFAILILNFPLRRKQGMGASSSNTGGSRRRDQRHGGQNILLQP